MTSGNVEKIHNRLRDELQRFGSLAEAARVIGDDDSQGLRDVCTGRKRITAELLTRLAAAGVDVLFVLTGNRFSDQLGLDPMRRAVLDSFDRCSPEKQIEAVQYLALLAAGVSPGVKAGAAPAATVKAKVSKSLFGVAVNQFERGKPED